MNILIVGCGKVGSRLAEVLDRKGHDVSIIERNEENFNLLSDDFNGFTNVGVPIDQDALRRAGIENCDALCAMTPDDNVNIMVSQLATEIFKVPKVLTRIYDPRRGDIFSHFGLQTICPTNLTVNAVCSALDGFEDKYALNFQSHTVNFNIMEIPKEYIDAKTDEIIFEEKETLFAIIRADKTIELIGNKTVTMRKGDTLIFSKIVD